MVLGVGVGNVYSCNSGPHRLTGRVPVVRLIVLSVMFPFLLYPDRDGSRRDLNGLN